MNDEKLPLTAGRAGIELDVLLYVTVTIGCGALNIAPGVYVRISVVGLQRGSSLQFSMAAKSLYPLESG